MPIFRVVGRGGGVRSACAIVPFLFSYLFIVVQNT